MSRTQIIAEVGVNHCGDLNIAKKLINKLSKLDIDFIKFQSFKTDELTTTKTKKTKYQKKNTSSKISYKEMLKKYELSFSDHKKIIKYCNLSGIKFLSTPFDVVSLKELKKFNLKFYKISSGDIDNYQLLKEIGSLNKKIFLSTGMSEISDIRFAIKTLKQAGTKLKNITLLQCTSSYPTKYEDVNLNVMQLLKKTFKLKVGLSDHSLGIEIPIAASALGAEVIEKHVTIDKSLEGPDHKTSLSIKEFEEMVLSIRNIEKSFGNKNKKILFSERDSYSLSRKSIFAKKNILKGEDFSEKNICIKRPNQGLSPKMWPKIINKKSKRNYKKDDPIIYE